jgi:PAS domain-containing protein
VSDFLISCASMEPEVASEAAQALVAYWDAKRLGRAMPARRDLDVLDLRPWLGRLSLYEVLGDGDFRIRLRGTTMSLIPVPNHASDGILVSRTKPSVFAEMGLTHYQQAYALERPTLHHIELGYDGFSYDYERVTLPLAEGAGLPPMVMTLIGVDVRRSREFWRRFNADTKRTRPLARATASD